VCAFSGKLAEERNRKVGKAKWHKERAVISTAPSVSLAILSPEYGQPCRRCGEDDHAGVEVDDDVNHHRHLTIVGGSDLDKLGDSVGRSSSPRRTFLHHHPDLIVIHGAALAAM